MCKWTVATVIFGIVLIAWLGSNSGQAAVKGALDDTGRYHYLKAKAGQK